MIKIDKFLQELYSLQHKHGIYIEIEGEDIWEIGDFSNLSGVSFVDEQGYPIRRKGYSE